MPCTAANSYLTLLPYYHNESKSNIQDQFPDNRKAYNGSDLQIWKPFTSTVPNFTKNRYNCSIERLQRDSHDILNFNCIQI